MIISELKPLEDLQQALAEFSRLFLVGCAACATACKAGGEEEVEVPGQELLEAVDSAQQALAVVGRFTPDLVITDVRMPPTLTNEGIRAAREIRSRFPDTGVIVVADQKSETGDVVKVMATRPLSKTKSWRLVEVVSQSRSAALASTS